MISLAIHQEADAPPGARHQHGPAMGMSTMPSGSRKIRRSGWRSRERLPKRKCNSEDHKDGDWVYTNLKRARAKMGISARQVAKEYAAVGGVHVSALYRGLDAYGATEPSSAALRERPEVLLEQTRLPWEADDIVETVIERATFLDSVSTCLRNGRHRFRPISFVRVRISSSELRL
jgi:hypothetical protein